MNKIRIALANIKAPSSPEESISLVEQAIQDASRKEALIVCFPECFVPGYRGAASCVPPADAQFLEKAWARVSRAAAKHRIAVILGTERLVDGVLRASAVVFHEDGAVAGFQDKVQVDPSEDGTYAPGAERQMFQVGPLRFGVVICHEGWRYPETVRWAARRGAQVVFHPHYDEVGPTFYRPTLFADPNNTFHEKAMVCRAVENTIFFASVNAALEGSSTTSAVIRPDGSVVAHQPYWEAGVLVADIDLDEATGLLASRCRTGI